MVESVNAGNPSVEPGSAAGGAETLGNAPESGRTRHLGISESAVRRVRSLMQSRSNEGLMLRVMISGGGCSGFQYGFSFDDVVNDDDFLFERDGIRVVVDDVSLDLLDGAEVDYVEELIGASFQVKNPNATSACGCGTSFAV